MRNFFVGRFWWKKKVGEFATIRICLKKSTCLRCFTLAIYSYTDIANYSKGVTFFRFYLNQKVDLFDHCVQQFGVVVPIIASEIEFPMQLWVLRPRMAGSNDRTGRLFDEDTSKKIYSKGIIWKGFGFFKWYFKVVWGVWG